MAPKRVAAEVLGEITPPDRSPTSGSGDKKKDDTTPTPVVDKDVTPSEDDKKKKDSSSTAKKGNTTSSTQNSQHTELTELSPAREGSTTKRKDIASRKRRGMVGEKRKATKQSGKFNKQLKQLRKHQAKRQAKKLKHPRSFAHNIVRILRSVNESQEQDGVADKRCNPLAMMIFDSFANDLCDKVIATAVELVRNTGKRQLGSAEIKAAMKLALPSDMASCADQALQSALMSYKESTKKYQSNIQTAKDRRNIANKKDDDKDKAKD